MIATPVSPMDDETEVWEFLDNVLVPNQLSEGATAAAELSTDGAVASRKRRRWPDDGAASPTGVLLRHAPRFRRSWSDSALPSPAEDGAAGLLPLPSAPMALPPPLLLPPLTSMSLFDAQDASFSGLASRDLFAGVSAAALFDEDEVGFDLPEADGGGCDDDAGGGVAPAASVPFSSEDEGDCEDDDEDDEWGWSRRATATAAAAAATASAVDSARSEGGDGRGDAPPVPAASVCSESWSDAYSSGSDAEMAQQQEQQQQQQQQQRPKSPSEPAVLRPRSSRGATSGAATAAVAAKPRRRSPAAKPRRRPPPQPQSSAAPARRPSRASAAAAVAAAVAALTTRAKGESFTGVNEAELPAAAAGRGGRRLAAARRRGVSGGAPPRPFASRVGSVPLSAGCSSDSGGAAEGLDVAVGATARLGSVEVSMAAPGDFAFSSVAALVVDSPAAFGEPKAERIAEGSAAEGTVAPWATVKPEAVAAASPSPTAFPTALRELPADRYRTDDGASEGSAAKRRLHMHALREQVARLLVQRRQLQADPASASVVRAAAGADRRRQEECPRCDAVRRFLDFRAANTAGHKEWAELLDESFVLVLPVAQYRKHCAVGGCSDGGGGGEDDGCGVKGEDAAADSGGVRRLSGIDAVMGDTQAIADLVTTINAHCRHYRAYSYGGGGHHGSGGGHGGGYGDGYGDGYGGGNGNGYGTGYAGFYRGRHEGRDVRLVYQVAPGDILLSGNTAMCHWRLTTEHLRGAGGFSRECAVDGMLRCRFGACGRIVAMKITYDVLGFTQQLRSLSLLRPPPQVPMPRASSAPAALAGYGTDGGGGGSSAGSAGGCTAWCDDGGRAALAGEGPTRPPPPPPYMVPTCCYPPLQQQQQQHAPGPWGPARLGPGLPPPPYHVAGKGPVPVTPPPSDIQANKAGPDPFVPPIPAPAPSERVSGGGDGNGAKQVHAKAVAVEAAAPPRPPPLSQALQNSQAPPASSLTLAMPAEPAPAPDGSGGAAKMEEMEGEQTRAPAQNNTRAGSGSYGWYYRAPAWGPPAIWGDSATGGRGDVAGEGDQEDEDRKVAAGVPPPQPVPPQQLPYRYQYHHQAPQSQSPHHPPYGHVWVPCALPHLHHHHYHHHHHGASKPQEC